MPQRVSEQSQGTDENGSDMLLNGFDVDRALATGESNEFEDLKTRSSSFRAVQRA